MGTYLSVSGPIFVDYVANPQFNAIAFAYERAEFIGLFLGTPALV